MCLVIKIATQTTGFAPVVSWNSDCDSVDHIISHIQAKVSYDSIVKALLEDLHLSLIEVKWNGCQFAIYLENTKKKMSFVKL